MKKHFYTILGVIVYGGILCGLLALQLLMIDGTFPRIIANLSALALTIPTILIFALYHKKMHNDSTDSVSNKDDARSSIPTQINPSLSAFETESVPKPSSTSHDAHSYASLEEIRVHVYDFLRQKNLSNREIEVAWLIYRGYSNIQIAEELYISETTVKKHASHIYEKLDLTGRKEFKSFVKASLSYI